MESIESIESIKQHITNSVYDFVYYGLISFLLIKIIHKFLCVFKTRAIWFQLHSAINFFIAYWSFKDVIECLLDPNTSREIITHKIAGSLAFTLHFYHMFFFKLRLLDWYHHILSVFICTPMALLYTKKGFAFYCFFCTGFPGAIDYALLALIKNNIIAKDIEKRVNSNLNAYIRMPGGVIGSLLIFKDGWIAVTPLEFWSNTSLAFLVYINTCYFGQQAIENNGFWKKLR